LSATDRKGSYKQYGLCPPEATPGFFSQQTERNLPNGPSVMADYNIRDFDYFGKIELELEWNRREWLW
jgi:hypothetical protein